MKAALLAAAALLASCATDSQRAVTSQNTQAELARALAGRVAGPAVACIDQDRVDGPRIFGAQTLIYRQSGARSWRNDLAGECLSLGRDDIIIVEITNRRLCRNDRFRAISRNGGVPGPFCRLGEFIPYDKVRGR